MKDVYSDFEAKLYLSDGELLAEGTASVDLSEQSATFSSDFVPLYELETEVYIIRYYKGEPIHRFNGQVYLSDKQLMRLVSLKDELYEGSQYCYSCNVKFNGAIAPLSKKEADEQVASIKQFKNIEFEVAVNDMTDEKVYFDVIKSQVVSNIFKKLTHNTELDIPRLEEGQIFSIVKCPELKNIKVPVKINKAYHFGDNPRLECDIINMSTSQLDSLKELLWAYNLENNKLF